MQAEAPTRNSSAGRTSLWPRVGAVGLLAMLVHPPDAAEPGVTAVTIVPGVVMTDGKIGTTFRLEAQLWSGAGTSRFRIEKYHPSNKVAWQSSHPWIVVDHQDSLWAVLRVVSGVPSSGTVLVTAKAAGVTSSPSATIVIDANPVAPESDALTGAYAPDIAPDVALANGSWAPAGSCGDRLFAYVRAGRLGTLLGRCPDPASGWGLAIFSVAGRMRLLRDTLWTPGSDQIDVSQHLPVREIPVAVRVFLGGPELSPEQRQTLQTNAQKFALDEIAVANSILQGSRVGDTLALIESLSIPSESATEAADCLTAGALTAGHDRPGVLTLYYLNTMGNLRGLTCPTTGGGGSGEEPDAVTQVIYLSYGARMPGSMAHEVGHALGLTLPGKGHTETLAGFDLSNMMVGFIDDSVPVGRRSFSIGQSFRMNVDSASWLNSARTGAGKLVRPNTELRLACPCGDTGDATHCPLLALDVATVQPPPNTPPTNACGDRIATPAYSGDVPRGLLAGRRWRAPPGTCTALARGVPTDVFGITDLLFPNMTRPGRCPSWVVITFEHHRLVYLALQESASHAWTDTADRWLLPDDDAANGLRDVAIQVYFPATQSPTDRKETLDQATHVFGGENRTGLQLSATLHAGEACPQPGTTGISGGSTVFDLCFTSVNANGTVDVHPGRRVARVGASASRSEVLRTIGMLLGLPGVSAAEGFGGNVMQAIPGDRGRRLTVGQVFRMNVIVDPASLPDCDAAPEQCPALAADIAL